MPKKKRTITSRHVATKEEQEQAASEGSRFLTEEEKDEIEADVAGGTVKEKTEKEAEVEEVEE